MSETVVSEHYQNSMNFEVLKFQQTTPYGVVTTEEFFDNYDL